MSGNRLLINTADFIRELRNLPEELSSEAQGIVTGAAEAAKNEIVAGYPEVTGNLKRGVTVKTETSAHGASAIVKSNAKHSHLYEFGSQTRKTDIGANRGAMPARAVFIPVVMRKRRQMYASLVGLLQRAGFKVSGTP